MTGGNADPPGWEASAGAWLQAAAERCGAAVEGERAPLFLLSVPLAGGGTEPVLALADADNLLIRLSSEAGPLDNPLISWDEDALAALQAALAGARFQVEPAALLVVAEADPAVCGGEFFGALIREVAEAAVNARRNARRRHSPAEVFPDADPIREFTAGGEPVHLPESVAESARALAASGRKRDAVRLVREHVPRLGLRVAKALVDGFASRR
ncbi:MAG: hypothetical protein FJZ01_15990 [Candidatus Sericytochromatia bacterium]|nr:hypothetical protein [Candidatus Tanganyikabacteria bacterium]